MNISTHQIKSLSHGMPGKKRNRIKRVRNKELNANHEMWRTCQRCDEVFDAKKEVDNRCPKCGSFEIE